MSSKKSNKVTKNEKGQRKQPRTTIKQPRTASVVRRSYVQVKIVIYGSRSNYVFENLGPPYILLGKLFHIFFPNKCLNKFMSFNFMPHLGFKDHSLGQIFVSCCREMLLRVPNLAPSCIRIHQTQHATPLYIMIGVVHPSLFISNVLLI